jgi:ABC-2 type transport system ATP-binding protein
MNTIIETTGLSRTFGHTEAVRDVTLAIPSGSVVALLGPNGAGKTTLLKLLTGLQRPTAGHARVLGRDPTQLRPKDWQRIGYVSDDQRLPLWMTVQQFLGYCRDLYPRWDKGLADRLVGIFTLPQNRKLSQLSRGMRAKAALVSSLAYRPELLLLDEPLSGIDIVTREEIMVGVLELAATEGGLSTMLSSHEIDDVERLADWVVILMGGEVKAAESLAELQTRFQRIEVIGTAEATARSSTEIPPSWWINRGTESAAGEGLVAKRSSTSFTHTAWNGEATSAELSRAFPEAAINAEPMSLRQIYRAYAHRFAVANGERGAK